MPINEMEPTSVGAADRDRQSRMEDGPRSGPNKDGASAPHGASALGNEMGALNDAQRERAAALAEGDNLGHRTIEGNGYPSGLASGATGSNPFGQLQGADKGYGNGPSGAERQGNQAEKDNAWQQGGAADIGSIARNSAGTANNNPTQDPNSIVSSGNRRADQILDTASRSGGTESGFGAYDGGVVNQAGTNNVPDN